ncbi:hypothetical protein AB1E19_018577 [Capra hircus]
MVAAILRLPSAKERQEAFSTCSSHRSVLSLMYGSCVFIYLKPKQVSRLDSNKEAALVNAVVTPQLNPVIYTLRNKQVHQALRDTLSRWGQACRQEHQEEDSAQVLGSSEALHGGLLDSCPVLSSINISFHSGIVCGS